MLLLLLKACIQSCQLALPKKKNERDWILFALNSSVSVLLIDFISFHFYFPFHDNSNR